MDIQRRESHGGDVKLRKGVMYQVQVTWLAFDFGTRGKEEDSVQLCRCLEHSVWLITPEFNVNQKARSSFKTRRKGGDQSSEKDGEV